MEKVVVIIGAGLSGLSCAFRLKNIWDSPQPLKVVCIDGRDRVGGRLLSEEGVDLGAAWSWSFHDKELTQLAKQLNVKLEPQYSRGKAIMLDPITNQPMIIGQGMSPSGEGSTRFKNGVSSIPQSLSNLLAEDDKVSIELNTHVKSINYSEATVGLSVGGESFSEEPSPVEVITTKMTGGNLSIDSSVIKADAVVLAMPPKLVVSQIQFNPDLPVPKRAAMQRTPTWMENTGKVAFLYSHAFWKDNLLSGTAFSREGPLQQIWDNSASDGSTFALAGFVFDEDLKYLHAAHQSQNSLESIKASPIMTQLVALFGQQAANPSKIVFKSWAHDVYTATSATADGELPFGTEAVRTPHGPLVFAGTETAPGEHGHMNGAVIAGYRAADEVYKMLAFKTATSGDLHARRK